MKRNVFIASVFFAGLFAAPAFGAIQYNLKSGTGEAYFSVDSPATVYVDVKQLSSRKNVALQESVITNIGYYHYDDVANYRQSGKNNSRPGRPGSGLNSSGNITLHYGDMKTGVLGEFKTGDKIVLWVETTSANGRKETFAMYSPTAQDSDVWMLAKSGESIVFNWGDFGVDYGKKSQHVVNPRGFQFSVTTRTPASGQPLPGIVATLLLGGGTLLYLKKRKKFYASK